VECADAVIADLRMPADAVSMLEDKNATASASATKESHNMTPKTTVAIALTKMALDFNKTDKSRKTNGNPQSSVPRKVKDLNANANPQSSVP
jgi:hypothetical protein